MNYETHVSMLPSLATILYNILVIFVLRPPCKTLLHVM